jgi:uncharacterized membrane protein
MTVTTVPAAPTRTRVQSVDVVRGIVMVLMAIDHVRVYSGVPAGGPTAGVFFTRWVTHFCAPVFVFFAGTSAYLMLASAGSKDPAYKRDGSEDPAYKRAAVGRVFRPGIVSKYLFTRGAFLVLLEPTLIRLSWTFSLDYSQFLLAGVIWMLGVCMILMAALVWLPLRAITALGFLLVVGQDAFGALPPGWFSEFLYFGGEVATSGPTINVLYSIVPWIGVMALGYAFGAILTREPAARDRACLRIGLSATAVFVVLAAVEAYMDGGGEDSLPFALRVLNQRKYPASQLFLLMTLGPAIAVMPFADRARGTLARVVEVFGRVPMFYYLLHIPVIHVLALLVWQLRDGTTHADAFVTAPYVWMPDSRWPLWLLYVVFVAAVALLYPMCAWYAAYKARTRGAWTRYV